MGAPNNFRGVVLTFEGPYLTQQEHFFEMKSRVQPDKKSRSTLYTVGM